MRQHHKFIVRLGITALLLMLLGGGSASNWFGAKVGARQIPAATADTKGTDFWLAFGQNYDPTQNASLPLSLTLFITSATSTTGTVSVPGLAISIPFSVAAGGVTTVPIDIAAQLTENDNGVDNDGAASDGLELKGVHVTAVDEVTVYGLNRRPTSTDAFLGLPTDILGQEYITLGYANSSFTNPGNQTQLAVVGTQAGTVVTITPSVTTGAHAAGTPFNITLNVGDTYQLMNAVANVDLTGTIITSTQPVAVFAGHSCGQVPQDFDACDYLVEQLQPTKTWGRRFTTMPLATRLGGDTFRFLAQVDGTDISVNGVVVATINRGQFFEQIIDGAAEVVSTQPILVAQYSNGSFYDGVISDPFMVIVPPVEQFQAGYSVTTPATGFATNFINVVVPTTKIATVTLDGAALTPANIVGGAFTPIGPIATSTYSGAQLIVGLGSHSVAADLPLGITVYGFDEFDSYGYPGGMSLAPVAVVTSLTLTPREATNPLNTQHCVTATIRSGAAELSAPVVGVRVDFEVSGTHSVLGFANTDAEGHAVFCYTGTLAGLDTITATQGKLTDTVTKTWVAIDAVDDTAGPVQGTVAHPGVIPNVLANDTLNGVPVTSAAVVLTTSLPDPADKLTLNADGSVDLAIAAAGTYTLTYQICDVLFPTSCDTALVTVSVLGGTPGISISKTTNGSDGLNIPAGAAIIWTYVVKNTGDTALTNVTVTDDKIAPTAIDCVGGSNAIASLVVGATVTCSATGTAVAGAYSNTGTASGTAPSGGSVSASDQSSYYGVRDLVVSKTTIPTFTRTYLWSLLKSVDKKAWEQIGGGTAPFTYSVVAAETGFTDSAFQVTGQITVSNPNTVIDITGVNVTDSVNNMTSGSCAVTNGTNLTILRGGSVQLSYTCAYTGAPTSYAGTNTASATWNATTHNTPSGSASGSTAVTFSTGAAGNPSRVNQTVTVTDAFNGGAPTTLGTAGPAVDVAPFASRTFSYPRTIPMPVPPAGGPVVPSLRLSSGATTVTVTDGGPGDANSMPGVITYVGPVGAWFMNVSTGQASGSAGAVGPGVVELNSVNMSSVTSTPLTILFSQSNTTPGFPGWNMSFGGTLSGNGSVTYSAYADDANNLFAQTTLIGTLGPYASGPFNGTVGSSVPVAAPYSLTQKLVITANQSAIRYSGDAWMNPVAAPAGCVTYPNTARIVETGQTSSQDVQVCGAAATGAMTMEYWQNQNGQALITAAGPATGTCSLTPWLRQFAPFKDLAATARCTAAATWVSNVIKAGKASGASMNAMLKAQLLATSLDVYFSDAALGGNKIAAPAPIGAIAIDLAKVPVAGTYQDVSSAFDGAKSLTVLQMVAYASTRSNSGGSTWYANVSAVQELAKNAFEAINRQMAFKQVQ